MKVLELIIEMQKKHQQNIPYKLMSKLDLTTVKNYFYKLEKKRELTRIAIKIQSWFRCWRERKFYK